MLTYHSATTSLQSVREKFKTLALWPKKEKVKVNVENGNENRTERREYYGEQCSE